MVHLHLGVDQRTPTASRATWLDLTKERKVLLFVCSEAVEYTIVNERRLDQKEVNLN